MNTYLRKLLRWWKEEVLTRIPANRNASWFYGRRDMLVNGEMIEPREGEVRRSLYGDEEKNAQG